jgi:hypothetical protein
MRLTQIFFFLAPRGKHMRAIYTGARWSEFACVVNTGRSVIGVGLLSVTSRLSTGIGYLEIEKIGEIPDSDMTVGGMPKSMNKAEMLLCVCLCVCVLHLCK